MPAPLRQPAKAVCSVCRMRVRQDVGCRGSSRMPFSSASCNDDTFAIGKLVWELLTSQEPLGNLSPVQREAIAAMPLSFDIFAIDAPRPVKDALALLLSPNPTKPLTLEDVERLLKDLEGCSASLAEDTLEQFLWGF